MGYLVKPYHELNLTGLVYQSLRGVNSGQHTLHKHSETLNEYLIVKSKVHGKLIVHLSDIVYLKKQGDHIFISCTHQVYKIRATLEQMLPDLNDNFFRVHYKYYINIAYLRAIKKTELMLTKKFIPIGKDYDIAALKNAFSERTVLK